MPTGLDGKTEFVLTERVFLGRSYFHIFLNDKTGEEFQVEITEREYTVVGESIGGESNPVLDGYTWKQSVGGAIKVDSPTGYLSEKEYVVVEGKACVSLKNKLGSGMSVALSEIVNDTIKIDTGKVIEATAEAEVITP